MVRLNSQRLKRPVAEKSKAEKAWLKSLKLKRLRLKRHGTANNIQKGKCSRCKRPKVHMEKCKRNPAAKIFKLFFRHLIVSCQDAEKIRAKYAMAKVLRTLQVQTESFLMLLLQTHILAHNFQLDREETLAQLVLVGLSLTSLAKDCAEHHFHELSGKSYIPYCSQGDQIDCLKK